MVIIISSLSARQLISFYIKDRLSMLICPEGSDELRKKQQPSSWILALAKSQTPVLKGFLEMPLDIVFEASCPPFAR